MHTQPDFSSSTNAVNSLRFSHEARGTLPCALKKSLQPDPISLPECFYMGWRKSNSFKGEDTRNEERKATKRRMQERKGKVESREA